MASKSRLVTIINETEIAKSAESALLDFDHRLEEDGFTAQRYASAVFAVVACPSVYCESNNRNRLTPLLRSVADLLYNTRLYS